MTYVKARFRTITGTVILAPVNQGDPNPGILGGLLDIFMLEDPSVSEPIRVRIHQHDRERNATMKEKVNSLVGKPVKIVIHQSPWSACGKSGITNYLQSIEEIPN